MKIFFIGWNQNGEKCLRILLKQGYKVDHVIVPSGFDTSSMYGIANRHAVPISENNGDMSKLIKMIRQSKPDLIIMASFPKLISQEIIDYPKLGTINVHTGELPKYRGYHPLNWAIIRDEKFIGVTVHYVDRGMDSGNILGQGRVALTNTDDINTVKNKLTALGSKILVKIVRKISKSQKKLEGIEQRDSEVIFSPKRLPQDGKIKWTNNARDIFNLVRALKFPYDNGFALRSDGTKITFSKSFLSKNVGLVLAKVQKYYLIVVGDGVVLLKTESQLKIGEYLK